MTTQLATLARSSVGGTPLETPRSRLAGLVAAVILVIIVSAAGPLAWPDHETREAQAPAAPAATPTLTGAVRASDVSMGAISYGVGQSSGWHVHPGIHAMLVTAGTLTVYDAACVRRTFGPGETYIGGQELHLARNETSASVGLIVTVIEPAVAADSVIRRPPPTACGNSGPAAEG